MSLKVALPNGFSNVTSAGTAAPLLALDDNNRIVKGLATVLLTSRQNKTTANAGDVYVGNRATQSQVLGVGESLSITVEAGEELDLSEIFLDAANSGDGVSYLIKRS